MSHCKDPSAPRGSASKRSRDDTASEYNGPCAKKHNSTNYDGIHSGNHAASGTDGNTSDIDRDDRNGCSDGCDDDSNDDDGDENYYSEPDHLSELEDAWLEVNLDESVLDGGIVEETPGDDGANRIQTVHDMDRAQRMWESLSPELKVYLFAFLPDPTIVAIVKADARYMDFLGADRRRRLFGATYDQARWLKRLFEWRQGNLIELRRWLSRFLFHGLIEPSRVLELWAEHEVQRPRGCGHQADVLQERHKHKAFIVATKLVNYCMDNAHGDGDSDSDSDGDGDSNGNNDSDGHGKISHRLKRAITGWIVLLADWTISLNHAVPRNWTLEYCEPWVRQYKQRCSRKDKPKETLQAYLDRKDTKQQAKFMKAREWRGHAPDLLGRARSNHRWSCRSASCSAGQRQGLGLAKAHRALCMRPICHPKLVSLSISLSLFLLTSLRKAQ